MGFVLFRNIFPSNDLSLSIFQNNNACVLATRTKNWFHSIVKQLMSWANRIFAMTLLFTLSFALGCAGKVRQICKITEKCKRDICVPNSPWSKFFSFLDDFSFTLSSSFIYSVFLCAKYFQSVFVPVLHFLHTGDFPSCRNICVLDFPHLEAIYVETW